MTTAGGSGAIARREHAIFLAVLFLLAAPAWWRASNSHAESRHASKAWEQRQYSAAAEAFGRAQATAPTARGAFNLGTAQIAAGELPEGAATLEAAVKDPELRADALFNRGNAALAAETFDEAIRDYVEALKTNSRHTAAKRNLEIALARRDSRRRQSDDQKKDESGPKEGEEQPSPAEGGQQPEGQPDLEALLRSIQQQEQEELRRMKGRAADVPVGW